MGYLSGIVTGAFSTPIFLIFLVACVGYFLGRIEIRGVSLGTAAVFLAALIFGHFGYGEGSLLHEIGLVGLSTERLKATMDLTQSIGLACFVTAVGFIAGPRFFHDLKRNARSYVLLAVVIIGLGCLTCLGVIRLAGLDPAVAVGLLVGALTTTPGFASAQDALAGSEAMLDQLSVGMAVAYPFGVVGVVLFVQLVPKLLRADMAEERRKLSGDTVTAIVPRARRLLTLDPFGFGAFTLAILIGILVGRIHVPLPGGSSFALGNTGGMLLAGLVLGHFGRIGPLSMKVEHKAATALRELGLVLFLIGAGVPGGAGFVAIVREEGAILFVYGALMTILPMVGGFALGKWVMKLDLLNDLGAITGGMTSTPALGSLIGVAETDDVAAAYAATYPVALVLIVLGVQVIVTVV